MIRSTIISIAFFLICITAQAQEVTVKIDTTAKKPKPNFRPASIRFGTDVYTLANTAFQDGFSGWEITADTELHRYLIVADYGHSEEEKGDAESFYTNSGNYWRVGIDANFLTRDPDKNAFFIGVHYGRSSFDEYMSVNKIDTVFNEPISKVYNNKGMKVGWLELNSGLKVRILDGFWLGYTVRFKFGISDKPGEMLSHSVPGYGVIDKETAWGFNYYIFYRIPLRPTKSILPPKK